MANVRVFLQPAQSSHPEDNGIGRVLHAQYEHLPSHGVTLVDNPSKADVIACHTQDFNLPISVCHLHGIYFTGDPESGTYNNWHHGANKKIVEAVRRSLAITVPSEWVGENWKRDMRLHPIVIPHGIDTSKWVPSDRTDGYILWGKNRRDDVCNPTPAWELAIRGYKVISTFAPADKPIPPKMAITGMVPSDEMRDLMRGAYIYLATTKETFGIQTLESMSCGVPVAGFDWGGTRDLVRNGIEGILVRPYDYDALDRAVQQVHENHAEMREACIARAREYTWDRAIGMYAELYRRIAGEVSEERKHDEVAVVIPCHNYGEYLKEALRSLIKQTLKPAEVIVVDDASSDDSTRIAEEYRQRMELEGVRYKVITHETNRGVAASRNEGVSASVSPFVVCLDADDRLSPLYLRSCRDALMRDRAIGIAYTGLGLIQPDGNVYENAWPGEFSWEFQAQASIPPHTTIPTGAMFRRSMWERSGGYRQRYAPGEDAEFYTRGLSLGFTAVKVSESPLIEYRNHGGGAHSTRTYLSIDDDKPWMRDRQYPIGAPMKSAPLVRSYSDPLVTVFIDGPDMAFDAFKDTIESVVGQTWREWEIEVLTPNWSWAVHLFPFVKKSHSAPLCVRITAGTVLSSDYLRKGIEAFITNNNKFSGGDIMGSCCGGSFDARQMAQMAILKQDGLRPDTTTIMDTAETLTDGVNIRMEYIGGLPGATTFFGMGNRKYRGGANALERYADVHKDDVEKLQNSGAWRIVRVNREVKGATNTKSAEVEPTPVRTNRDFTGVSVESRRVEPVVRDTPVEEARPVESEIVPDKFKRIVPPDSLTADFDGVDEGEVQKQIDAAMGAVVSDPHTSPPRYVAPTPVASDAVDPTWDDADSEPMLKARRARGRPRK